MTLVNESELDDSQISVNFDFLWDPEQRRRAIMMTKMFDMNNVRLWLRYVIEGGGRDMYEFIGKYQGRFKYCQTKGWDSNGREDFWYSVKSEMQKISNTLQFNFLFCPFMKKRAMDLINCGINYDSLSRVLCYVITGEQPDTYKINSITKSNYLKRVGIFP